MAAVKENLIGKWERKVRSLAKKTGYEFTFLWKIWQEILEEDDPLRRTKKQLWNYFKDVTYEHDW